MKEAIFTILCSCKLLFGQMKHKMYKDNSHIPFVAEVQSEEDETGPQAL